MREPDFPHIALVQGPAIEPVTLDEVRTHLRIDDNESDADISRLIEPARMAAEDHIARALITQTLDITFPEFCAALRLPRSPIQSITSVKYTDTAGDEQTLDAGVYRFQPKKDPAEVRLEYGQSWPTTYAVEPEVTIRAVVGYGDAAADVPAPIRHAILLIIGHMYENREETLGGFEIKEIPLGAKALLSPYVAYY